ncbi:SpvB/TcaC N-terminal domain-containing protein [Marinobacter sp. DUT-1]|uniref:SpvB/TcaC N-terminal domain-containing protein n=1 Tax=Marinobacter sp. DUT-1 TaxID=3412037 RepID=UPI003D187606
MEFWRQNRRTFAFVALFSLLAPQLAQAATITMDSVRSSPKGWSLQSAAALPPEIQAVESATLEQAFDRDTATEYTAYDDQSFDITLEGERDVTAIRVFGAAPYTLTVQEKANTGWRDIQGLKGLDLTSLPPTWNSFSTNNAARTEQVRVVLEMADSPATGLRELEIWSNGEHLPVETGEQLSTLLEEQDLPDQAVMARATPAHGEIGRRSETNPDDPTDNTFTAQLPMPASQIKYAWLAYELNGLSHWAEAIRVINDQPALGGVVVEGSDSWNAQLERISPTWLKQGANRIRFTAPSDKDFLYQVRNVRLVVEMDNGANFVSYVSASATDDNATIDSLYDGQTDSGMVVYSGTGVGTSTNTSSNETALPPGLIDNPGNGLHLGWVKGKAAWKQALASQTTMAAGSVVELGFDREVELETVGFYLRGSLAGKIGVQLYVNGGWQETGAPDVSARSLKGGWNEIPVASGNRVRGARLVFTGGEGSAGEVRELTVRGSGIGGAWLPPEVVVTYPDAGQYYGREAYIRGFLQGLENESGEAELFIAGRPLNHVNGEFQTLISKDDIGLEEQPDDTAWTVQLEAVYPDGERSSVIVPLYVNKGALPEEGAVNDDNVDMPPVTSVPVTPEEGNTGGTGGAVIDVGPGAVYTDLDINMMPLRGIDLATMDSWMTNVTGPDNGYRFLPHGKHFKKKVEVRIKYNPSLLPPGFSEDDIRTFYFDENAGQWKELERKSIDKGKKEVVALTDHFTDMINAVIQIPDSPQNTQFNPTQIKDIKAADPGAKVNLIEPPQANNMGDARLSYPIEVPPGRQGMQPQLAVQYSSGGGHSWLGHGWDLSTQAITIDTRWGVPRYDAEKETETYLLNGSQLTPMAHVGEPEARSAEKVFHTRVEGGFQKIIRHGDNPTNYWWEVIDKSGTHYFYGGDDTRNGPQADDTLRTASGNIGHWALRLVRDSNGNEIRYYNTRVTDSGLGDGKGGVAGYQIYTDRIEYTGYKGQKGAYAVSFTRDREQGGFNSSTDRRQDVNIDARLGFKRVTADLLKRIDITYKGQPVRSYTFEYEQGAFARTLLSKMNQLDSKGEFFNAHSFSYYKDILNSDGNYQPLAGEDQWANTDDHIEAGLSLDRNGFEDGASATSGIASKSKGDSSAVTAGPNDGNLACKSSTIGDTRNSTKSSSKGLLALADINGDGLPDKIFVRDGRMQFRPGTPGGGFSGQTVPVVGATRFYEDTATSSANGQQAVLGCSGVSASYSSVTTNTYTSSRTYFTDANGDGLIDIAMNGTIYFNRLDDGKPTFLTHSGDTPNPIEAGADIDSDGLVTFDPQEYEQRIDDNPLHDTVRVWEAPYDGHIAISGPVALVEDKSTDRRNYEDADGVTVHIEHGGRALWSATLAANDYTPRTPEGVSRIPVTRGDLVFFRVQSVFDGLYDQVSWAPEIRYLDVPAVSDANNKPLYTYHGDGDFLAVAYPGQTVNAPIAGTVRVDAPLHKQATSDNVTVTVTLEDEVIWQRELAAGTEGTFNPDTVVEVSEGDTLSFRMEASTRIDWQALDWKPALIYTAAEDSNVNVTDGDGNPQIVIPGIPSASLYSATVTPVTAPLTIPEEVQVPLSNIGERTEPMPDDGTVEAVVTPTATFDANEGEVVFTVKRDGALVHKEMLVVYDGQLLRPEDVPEEDENRPDPYLPTPEVRFPVVPGETYWLEYHTPDTKLAQRVESSGSGVYYHNTGNGTWSTSVSESVTSGFYTVRQDFRFGPMFRQWGQFVWNGNRGAAEKPIDEAKLVLDPNLGNDRSTDGFEDISNSDQLESEFDANGYDSTSADLVLMFPGIGGNTWEGYDAESYIQPGLMSSSRYGLDNPGDPDPVAGAGARAIIKLTHSYNKSRTLGGSAMGVSGGAGETNGESRTLVDFLDMNGDRYPDIVGPSRIQYTLANGGLEAAPISLEELDGLPRVNKTEATSFNAGGSVGSSEPQKERTFGGMTIIYANSPPSVGITGNLGNSEDQEQLGWTDINGDGLPDRIYSNGTVALNLGYDFAPAENWGAVNRKGESESAGLSLGFNFGVMSIAGGLSLSRSETSPQQQLFDVNGDGLPDVVDSAGSGPIKVAINAGSGFLAPMLWQGAHVTNQTASVTEGGNVAATFCTPFPPFAPVFKACVNKGRSKSKGISREEHSLNDINGDGYPDFLTSGNDGDLRVKLNTHGRTNLLKSVQRPLGASFELDYERTGNTYDMPQSRWVLNKVTVHDGFEGDGVDSLLKTFSYANGYYDRRERDFFGFETVNVAERDAGKPEQPVSRSMTQTYLNGSVYERGLLVNSKMTDGQGNPWTESTKAYRFADIHSGQTVPLEALPSVTAATIFPQVTEETTRFYEGQRTPGKSTRVRYLEYDDVGNVTHLIDEADSGTEDDVEAVISYFRDESAWIMGSPESIRVTGAGGLLRERFSDIEPGTGNVKAIRQTVEEGEARYDFAYDQYGNLTKVTGPQNYRGQRYGLDYFYDPDVHTYVERMKDSFGYVSSADYDRYWGEAKETVSINGQRIITTYDSVGRVKTITGPYEQKENQAVTTGPDEDENRKVTIRFKYEPQVALGQINLNQTLNRALTQHYDPEHPNDPIETVLFTDGLKRVLQTKKDSQIGTGVDDPQAVMVASGRILFDHLGRSVEQYYPVTEPVGSALRFNATFDPIPPTVTEYDVQDRPLTVTQPDGATTEFDYGFGTDRDGRQQFRTTVTDANGVRKDSFRDVRQLITAVKEYNQGGNEILWTSYRYDPLKQITDVFDAQNNHTSAGYDLLGRRTLLANPDTGKVVMDFDLAGNLIHKETPNLRALGETITYRYDYNRLSAIEYPQYPDTNVSYEYGAPNAPHNGANRIIRVTDQGGWETRQYGPLGELTQSTRYLQWSAGPGEQYTTQYTYDTWNRLQQLVYPDGEVLTYDYDVGGQMHAVQGRKGSYDYPYVQRLDYDKFGQRTYVLHGNNTVSRYSYDPYNRRLSHLTVGKGDGNPFMDLSYGYDEVGNITDLANRASNNSPAQMGGATNYTYTYDDLYRLTDSSGTFDAPPGKQHRFTLSMGYDTIHNITRKTQVDVLRQPSGQEVTQKKTTYDWTYRYDGNQPHAPTHLGDRTFTYDANGNQLGWSHDQNGTRRSITWDDENRIREIRDNGHRLTYTYDASGQRLTKRGPQGETGYINQWFTLRNGEVGTKHIYAGTTRVVSKLVKQDKPNSKRKGRIVYEKDQYTYHPDHLGTSAYITHTNGQVYQHLEYFPFGETWVEEHSNKQRTPYLFTAKELDEESQLYYFGARYYDPRTSVWQSSDPIFNQYLNGQINGGVFNPRNLGLYSYTFNNPMIFVDPDGRAGEYVAFRAVWSVAVVDLFTPDASDAAAPVKAAGYSGALIGTAIGGTVSLGLNWMMNQGSKGGAQGSSDASSEGAVESENSGPATGNTDLDEVLSGATPKDGGKKGYSLPGTQDELIGNLGDIDGAEQIDRPDGGTTTVLPDGTKVDTYPGRSSTGKPGWSVTKPGATKPRIKGDTEL